MLPGRRETRLLSCQKNRIGHTLAKSHGHRDKQSYWVFQIYTHQDFCRHPNNRPLEKQLN